MADQKQPIIIKKIKKGGHGHHGGAWKVAYADFVTAMMAFFLLLWLLNATSVEQKVGLANYFAPVIVSSTDNDVGGPGILAGTAMDVEGAGTSSTTRISSEASELSADASDGEGWGDGDPSVEIDELASKLQREPTPKEIAKVLEKQDVEVMKASARDLLDQVAGMPEFRDLTKDNQMIMHMTPEGLEINLSDSDQTRLFSSGSERPTPKTVALLGLVAGVINKLPNKVAITGHTDSTPFSRTSFQDNWDLSAKRANESRRVLVDYEFDAGRLVQVAGKADSDPLFKDAPDSPGNRRITLLIKRQHPDLIRRQAAEIALQREAEKEQRIFNSPDVRTAPTHVRPWRDYN